MAKLLLNIDEPGIAVLHFVNPPAGFLNAAMAVELETVARRLAGDPAIRVIVLTGGQPDVFIRHFDMAELAGMADAVRASPPPDDADWKSSLFHRTTRCLEEAAKPTIAAINGACMGVGYELALACDLRIAADGEYPIGLPEVNIGICPGGGGTVRLNRLVGTGRALEMLYLGQTFSPAEALAAGLINRIAPDALTEALKIARALLSRAPGGLAAIKQVSYCSADQPLEAALTIEQRACNARLGSTDMPSLMRRMIEESLDIRDV
jgi:enoyl-CoA hydratase/carnithine racemase